MDLLWDHKRFWEEIDQDEEMARELVDLFFSSSRKLLQEMEEALRQGDLPKLRERAHSLKGAAGTIYLESVKQRALALERGSSNSEEARKILAELRELCAILEREAEKLLSF